MKLGQIKLEALKIMNESGYKNLVLENYENYLYEPRFQKFLYNMDASINRAIDYINNAQVVKSKTIKLTDYTLKGDNFVVFDMDNMPPHTKILYTFVLTENGVEYPETEMVGNIMIVRDYSSVYVVYIPKLEFISLNADYMTEVDIPDNIAYIIPYFIKYDLYQEEEPELSLKAKEMFESLVKKMIKENVEDKNYSIKAVFSQL